VTQAHTPATFVIRLADIEAGPLRLQLPIKSDWLEQALVGTEARPWLARDGGADEGELSVQVSTSGRNVLVRGRVRAAVTLPCARTLDPANYHLDGEVFLLLSPATPAAHPGQPDHGSHRAGARGRAGRDESSGKGSKERGGRGGEHGRGPKGPANAPTAGAKASGKKKGEKGDWSEDPELSEEEAALDTFSGDQIVLDDFLREFILLELPMFPVREDLRSESFEGSSAPPDGAQATGASLPGSSPEGERPLDPRLSPLADLKARLDERARLEKKE
jgi:uncharacterized protein